MAKTVAEIDGDSSGLVSELGEAKKAMADLGTQGKKLTDQLKDVADQADVAAGNLVNKIGGPGAIQAIGGIGIAFAGVGKALDAVGASMDSFYSAQGDKGAAAMDSINQSMDTLKGSLFEAVVGTNDLDEATETVIATLGIAKQAFDVLLLPISSVSQAIRQASSDAIQLGFDFAEAAKQEAYFKESIDHVTESNKLNMASVDELLKSLTKVLMTKRQIKEMNDQEVLDNIDLGISSIEAGAAARGAIAGEIAMSRAREEIIAGPRERLAAAIRKGAEESGYYLTQEEARARAIQSLEKDTKFMARIYEAENKAYAEANAANNKLTAEETAKREELLNKRANIEQMFAEQNYYEDNPPPKPKTGGAPKAGPPPEPKVDGMEAEQRARNEMAAILNANDKMEQQLTMDKLKALDDRINAETERKKAAIDAVNEYALEMERQHDAELHAQGKLTVKEQEELDKARLEQAKSYLADYTTAFMQSQGRQLAIGKLSAKEAGDFARKQLGNAIMGLGDKAMAEAGIMAASLNPLAIPMAAAGVAAYAVGSALNADKKQVATEPPTEVAGAQAQPASYSFNLQVDSVFADGESVARQFARMQESARQRGLLTQGAY